MFRIMEYMMINGPNDPQTIRMKEALNKGQEVMLRNGFEKLVIEDFCQITVQNLEKVLSGQHTPDTL